MLADLPPSPPPAVQPVASAPEWAFLAPRLDMKWGAPRDEAMAKLGAVFGASVAVQDLSVPDGRTLRMATFAGTVQGFNDCAILVFFNEDRLFGAEVIIPPQATGGAADLFKRVYVGQLASSGDRLHNAGFTIRQGENIDFQINGAEFCTPASVSRWIEGKSRNQIDRGVMKAEGFLLFKSGGLIHMQSTSAGLEAKNPLYQLGCLIVGLKGFDPALIEKAEAQAATEREDTREDRRRRPMADADAADFQTPEFKALKARAERGELAAQKELAAVYVKGGDIRRDRAEAIRWCEKALAQGDASVVFPLATLYANRWYTFYPPFAMAEPTEAEHARAAALYERAGKAGNARALVQLAYLYEAGRGVKKDAKAYRRYMEQAARLGSPDGYAALAALEPRKSAEYTGRALQYMQEAANYGHVMAAWTLAEQYLEPESGRSNPVEAIRWLRCAVIHTQEYDSNIVLNARSTMSDLYATGRGVKKDPVEALKWKLLEQSLYPEDRRDEYTSDLKKLQVGMTAQAIAEAQRRAKDWLKAHPQVENHYYPFQ